MAIIPNIPKKIVPYFLLTLIVVALIGAVYALVGAGTIYSIDVKIWQFLLVFMILISINFGVLFALIRILKWRKIVENGMLAIVPVDIVNSTTATYEATVQVRTDLQKYLNEISKHLKSNVESIHILKHELELKEKELFLVKNGAAQVEKEKVVNKIAKIHTFLKRLETEVTQNRIEASSAIRFLNDELEDLFGEFGLHELEISPGDKLGELDSELYAVKQYETTIEPNEHMTVKEVVEQGYAAILTGGARRVVKPSIVIVKKLGE